MSYVLVAEPDPARTSIYKGLVGDIGLEIEVARDGERARSLMRTRGLPALLLTELALPRLDGFALLRALRDEPEGASVPAIVVSAFRDLRDEAVRRKSELGITALLARSSPVSAVQKAIQHALGTAAPSPLPPLTLPRFAWQPSEAEREARRLARIAAMNLVDDLPPDEGLQRLVAEVAEIFHVPIALVSLVLEHRQWFKAHFGLEGALLEERGTPRSWSFCRHVVENDQPLVVPDARLNPYFASNPLVRKGTVRGYAGVPLKAPSGEVLGTLCIVDTRPLSIGAEDLDLLQILARRVAGELELRSEARLATAEVLRQGRELALLGAITGHLDQGVMLLDAERRVVFVNEALERLTGICAAEVLGQSRDAWVEKLGDQVDDAAEARRRLAAPSAGPFVGQDEMELVRPTWRVLRWMAKPVALGIGTGQLCVYTDVTRERELDRQREALALTDFLTGLPNRRAAEEALLREAARADRTETPLSVVLLDIDRLDQINRGRGHDEGDRILRAVADAVRSSVRASDLACRWGGDEFLAILPGVDSVGARVMAERARAVVESIEPGSSRVTVSAGAAHIELNESVSALLQRTEARLAEARSAGRNQVR